MDRDEDDMPVVAYPQPQYIKGLPPGSSESALASLLSSFGPVRFCTIIPGSERKPYGLVRFRSMPEADSAIASLHGRTVQGADSPLDIRHIDVAYDGTNQPHEVEAAESVDIPQGLVGYVIGKGGETVKSLQARSGASISIDQNFPITLPRRMIMIGVRRNVEAAKTILLEIFAAAPPAMTEAKDALNKLSSRYNIDPPAVKNNPRVQRYHFVQQFQLQRHQYQHFRKQMVDGQGSDAGSAAATQQQCSAFASEPNFVPQNRASVEEKQHPPRQQPLQPTEAQAHAEEKGVDEEEEPHEAQISEQVHAVAGRGNNVAATEKSTSMEAIDLGDEAELAAVKLEEAQEARERADTLLDELSEDLPRQSVSPATFDPVALEGCCNIEMQRLRAPAAMSSKPHETLRLITEVPFQKQICMSNFVTHVVGTNAKAIVYSS
jgi:rRNA processing protein Krr1/Pno1